MKILFANAFRIFGDKIPLPASNNITVDSLTENPAWPFQAAFEDDRLARAGRTLDIEDQWLKITSTFTDIRIDQLFMPYTNISFTGSTVRLQANATDVWTSPSLDEPMTVTLYPESDIDSRPGPIVTQAYIYHETATNPGSTAYKYWRITIDSPLTLNPVFGRDTFLQIPQLVLGGLFLGDMIEDDQVPGMAPTQTMGLDIDASVSISPSGQLYGDTRITKRRYQISFPYITDEQRKFLLRMYQRVWTTRPISLIPWENDTGIESPIYGRLTASPRFQKLDQQGVAWSGRIEVEEVY